MRKRILTTLALAALSTGAMAQYNSRIQLELGNFGAPNAMYDKILGATYINNVGASIQHSVYKNIDIKINYQRWADLSDIAHTPWQSVQGHMGWAVDYGINHSPSYRFNYNIAEIAPVYTQQFGRHSVFGSLGTSVAWGKIGYYDLEYTMFEGGCEIASPSKGRSIEVGGLAEAGYNYRLGRISTGLSGAYRFYGKDFTTINLQLNIGYNFNSFK